MPSAKAAITLATKDRAIGKALREASPRTGHANLGAQPAGRDPVATILASDAGRLPELISERHRRMLASPFTFFRGAAGVQAQDLVNTASSSIIIQCCGDAHLMNFGGFATPERRLIFDLNDFDETLPAPFEWDVKRLAASVVLAARARGLTDAKARDITLGALAAYRGQMVTAAQTSSTAGD